MQEPSNNILTNFVKKSKRFLFSYHRIPSQLKETNIIPILKNSKKPAIKWEAYEKERYIDIKKLEKWEGNFATICGETSSDLIVVDFDSPQLYEKFFSDINTLTIKTPHGGYHLYFYDKTIERKILGYRGYPIDIIANGGYVLIPPSSIDGKAYEVIKDVEILKTDVLSLLNSRLPKVERETNIEELKRRIDISEVVKGYVQPAYIGKNYWQALCPFHQETHPSFTVYKDSYYCFGCGEYGDVINFIMKIENLSFKGAVNFLCEKYSLPSPFKEKKNLTHKAEKQAEEQTQPAQEKGIYASFIALEEKIFLEIRKKEGEYCFAYLDEGKIKFADKVEIGGKTYLPRPLPKMEGKEVNLVGLPDEGILEAKLLSPEELFNKIFNHFNKYIDLSPLDLQLCVYYDIFTWFYLKTNTLGYLRFIGDTGKGKSRSLQVVGDISFYPVYAGGCSTFSGIVRQQEKWKGTLIIDEADFPSGKENQIIKYLNLGFEKGKIFIMSDKKNPRRQDFFDPFSPKIMAMREPFKDNATEGRVLSISPYETQREDIPIILPENYRKEVQEIRNELALFTLYHWEKIDGEKMIEFKDLEIEPRLKQLAMPLSIIFQIWEEGIPHFREYLVKRQKELKKTRAQSWEGTVVNLVLSIAKGEEDLSSEFGEYYSPSKEISAITPSMVAKTLKTSPKMVTTTLASVGFEVEVRKITIHKGERKINKTVRAYCIPNEKTWREIIFRYYLPEEGEEEIPIIPEVLKAKKFVADMEKPKEKPFSLIRSFNQTCICGCNEWRIENNQLLEGFFVTAYCLNCNRQKMLILENFEQLSPNKVDENEIPF